MFRILKGPLGSGKTYYCVKYLREFTKYNKLYDTMFLDPEVLLVSNIDEIKIPHMEIKEFRELDLIDPEKLRTFMKDNRYKRVIYIHDEAQRIYAGLKENREFFFLEYSRHLGVDVFLIVQSLKALPPRLVDCAEYVIDAKPQSIGLTGFNYSIKDVSTGNELKRIHLRADKNVFRLYKSFDIPEAKGAAPTRYVLKRAVVGALIVIAAFTFVKFGLSKAFHMGYTGKVEKKKENIASIPTIQPSSNGAKIQPKTTTNQTSAGSVDELTPEWVILPGEQDIRPGGNIAGVSKTSEGTYVLFKQGQGSAGKQSRNIQGSKGSISPGS